MDLCGLDSANTGYRLEFAGFALGDSADAPEVVHHGKRCPVG